MATRVVSWIHTAAPGPNPNDMVILMYFQVVSDIPGIQSGEAVVTVDGSQTEGQIQNDLRTSIAAQVDAGLTPPQGLSSNDVRLM